MQYPYLYHHTSAVSSPLPSTPTRKRLGVSSYSIQFTKITLLVHHDETARLSRLHVIIDLRRGNVAYGPLVKPQRKLPTNTSSKHQADCFSRILSPIQVFSGIELDSVTSPLVDVQTHLCTMIMPSTIIQGSFDRIGLICATWTIKHGTTLPPSLLTALRRVHACINVLKSKKVRPLFVCPTSVELS